MRRSLLQLLLACAALATSARPAASEPVLGVDAAATVPIATYSHSVDAGGAISLWGGYGADVNSAAWVGFVLAPQFSFFAADRQFSRKTTTMFSLTGGPRLTLRYLEVEGIVDIRGGLYTDVGGPFDSTGGGWNGGVTLNWYLVPNTSLGIFARFESADLTASPTSDADREFLTTGLTVMHRFR